MIGRSGQGWAVTFADLSIILFMITAADLAVSAPGPQSGDSGSAMIATADPVAVFRPTAGISLHQWLDQQPADPRQLVTVLVRHPAEGMERAMAAGLRLAREAEADGRAARIIAEEGTAPELSVMLTYDSSPHAVARNLLGTQNDNQPEESR